MKETLLKIILIILLILLIGILVIKYKYTSIINSNEFTLEYKHIGLPQEDYIVVSDGTTFGYYDIKKNELLTKIEYQLPDYIKKDFETNIEELVFKDGLAPITNNNLMGIINNEGKIIIYPTYESLKIFNKELILVYKDSNYYFINSKEKELFNLKFETIVQLNKELFIVYDGTKYGIIDDGGKYILEKEYENIQIIDTEEINVIKTTKNEKEDYYLVKNKTINKLEIPETLSFITKIKDKIYFEDNNGMYQIHDLNNNKVIKLTKKYMGLGSFVNGIAQVANDKMKIGYINELEELIIPFEYDYGQTSDFSKEGYAIVEKEGSVGVINVDNEIIIPINYKEVYLLSFNNFLVVDINNKINIIDKNKTNLTNNKYTNIYFTENDKYLLVEIKNNTESLYGIINNKGEVIVEPKYKNIKVDKEYFKLKETDNKYTFKKINIIKNNLHN